MVESLRAFIWIIFFIVYTFLCAVYIRLFYVFNRSSDFVHNVVSHWGRVLIASIGSKVQVRGLEHIKADRAYILLANHQSVFDIFSLSGYIPLQFRFISKLLYFKIPLMGWGMKKAEYIPLDRKNAKKAFKSLYQAAEILKKKKSIIIFPEGTRNLDGNTRPFKPGLLKIAELAGEIDILPVAIWGTKYIHTRGQFKLRKASIIIMISPPTHVKKKTLKDKTEKKKILHSLETTIRRSYQSLSSEMEKKYD